MPRARRRGLPALTVPVTAALLMASACSLLGRSGSGEGLTASPTTSTTTGSKGGSSAPPAVGPPAWVPCQGDAGPNGFDCASIRVPLDYQHPSAGTIAIALDRRPASGTRSGSLLVNPGGPGVSGVDSLGYETSLLSPAVLDHFDVIGFDPRGVARSAPVTCVDGPTLDKFLDLDPAPTTDAGWQTLVNATKTFDQDCEAQSGAILPFVSTANAARDMDQIRAAVGDAKLTYLGFSYGTFLGATYAELFPTKVRAMALDGAIDPAADPIAVSIAQAAAFDQQLDAFFADCAADPSCAWRPGGDLHAAFDALMARIRAQRLPGSGARTLGIGEALYGVIFPLYDRTTWPDLAVALSQASRGSGSLLLRFFDQYVNRNPDGTYSNLEAANFAVNCIDTPWPSDPEALRQDAAAAAKAAPEFGLAVLYGNLSCVLWPVAATGHPHAIRAEGSPPIVVVGSTGDPATPYVQAKALAAELQHGVLITRQGDGHTGYRSSACVRQAVDAYLIDLTVPANGTVCQSP